MTKPNTPAKSLGEFALSDAIGAVKNEDSACYKAVTALSLIMSAAQIAALRDGESIDETEAKTRNSNTWRAFLKSYAAKSGFPVWRDTQDIVARFQALPRASKADRTKYQSAVSDYIDGGKNADALFAKPDKARLVDGLARIRTNSFRLSLDMVKNHADFLRNMVQSEKDGTSPEVRVQMFRTFIGETYGETFVQLSDRLSAGKPETAKPDYVAGVLKKAAELPENDLQRLVTALNQLWAEKQAVAAQVNDAFGTIGGDESDETESGETETPEAVAA